MARLNATQAITKGRFRVKITDIPEFTCQGVDGLGDETTIGRYSSSTDPDDTLTTGGTTVPDVEVSFGECPASLQPLYTWREQIKNADANGGLTGEQLERNVDIAILNEANVVIMRYVNEQCLCTTVKPDTREAKNPDTAIAKATFSVTRQRVVFGSGPG